MSRFKLIWVVQSSSKKYSAWPVGQITSTCLRCPALDKGALRDRHERWGILKSLASEIAKLEAAISAKIKSTPDFAERAEIIESVPGLAETSSANLVAGMPELG
ncbi:MAG TPA: hypothetical protein VNZ53_57810, partial [Steroidobacteraceae bacterium]|nr:hypothetical protein [Steroidobacteraceae bacterium]